MSVLKVKKGECIVVIGGGKLGVVKAYRVARGFDET